MPELPEVETIKEDLKKKILKKKIVSLQILDKKVVKNKLNLFPALLKGNQFVGIDRVGKLMIFNLKSGESLLIHLKMTGQLIYQNQKEVLVGGHSLNKKTFSSN